MPLVVALLEVLVSGCTERRTSGAPTLGPAPGIAFDPIPDSTPDDAPKGEVVLAFAGDVHFEAHLARLLDEPRGALGPIAETLSAADVTMVNLESAITSRGEPEAKELEAPSRRYHFRTSPAALDVLAAAGIDLVTMANNHGADFGPVGLEDTLRAIDHSPIPVIGIGSDRDAAFAPHRVSIRGTDVAFLAADGSMREGASNVWAAARTTRASPLPTPSVPGPSCARFVRPARPTTWWSSTCTGGRSWRAARPPSSRAPRGRLAEAGADIVVGTHAHVPLGSGWLGDTYVNYGLGNFLWYHDRRPESGVLQVRIEDGAVVGRLLGTC